MAEQRFVLIEGSDRFQVTERSCWWWDTARPLTGSSLTQPFVAIQCYLDEDPNLMKLRYKEAAAELVAVDLVGSDKSVTRK